MATLKIRENDLQHLWPALECDPTHLPNNPIKSILIHSYFKRTDDNKIRPPFILTKDDELFHASYNSDYTIEFIRFDALCGKEIDTISYGFSQGLILAKNGEIYPFGSNQRGSKI